MKNVFRISAVTIVFLSIFIIHSCKKKDKLTLPVITTTAVTAISYTTATSGGEITDIGGAEITSRGVCWNASVEPTISNSKTTENGGLGAFTSNLTQLSPNTIYYVRAYATNIVGTGYGNEVSFTTSQVAVPVLTTTAITSITQTTAVSGGNITADNGGSVTARGICWGIVQNPTISDSKTSDATGTGSFTSTLTGLIGNTTYYVRAYATNSAGTAYGSQVNFTTSPLIPTLTTATASSITSTTASGGGNVTSDGGATITARGLCYATTANPTVANTTVVATGTTGAFTTSITGLTANTTYYARAYATNIVGTAYGNEVSFTTSLAVTTITDIEGNIYYTVTIGTKVWMAENLKTTKYNDGTAIPNLTGNTSWAALTTGAYSDYNNTPANSTTYGRLYNWYAVDNNAATKVASNGGKNVCPTNWHVPTDAEWTTLTDYLGGLSIAGGKLKETGTTHWQNPNTGATNETGFTALPGGSRADHGTYNDIELEGYWWSSTDYTISTLSAYYREVYYNSSRVLRDYLGQQYGYSVRCLRDN